MPPHEFWAKYAEAVSSNSPDLPRMRKHLHLWNTAQTTAHRQPKRQHRVSGAINLRRNHGPYTRRKCSCGRTYWWGSRRSACFICLPHQTKWQNEPKWLLGYHSCGSPIGELTNTGVPFCLHCGSLSESNGSKTQTPSQVIV